MGMIARIRSRMSPNCAVRLSPYCDVIISMRMQGVPYRDIESWLVKQGEEHRVSAPTIWRNFKQTKLQVELPYAEELAERWGGRIDLDVVRELAGQIISQRKRIDRLLRLEEEKQKTSLGYHDKRIRGERETMVMMLRSLQAMMASPEEAAKEGMRADQMARPLEIADMSEDVLSLLRDALLSGELKISEPDLAGVEGAN